MVKLNKGDHIVCTYAERYGGPGGANSIVWLIIKDRAGVIRQEALQPEDWGVSLGLLFDIAAVTHKTMLYAVDATLAAISTRKKKK